VRSAQNVTDGMTHLQGLNVLRWAVVTYLVLVGWHTGLVTIRLNRTTIFFSLPFLDDAFALTLVLRPLPLTHASSPYANLYL